LPGGRLDARKRELIFGWTLRYNIFLFWSIESEEPPHQASYLRLICFGFVATVLSSHNTILAVSSARASSVSNVYDYY